MSILDKAKELAASATDKAGETLQAVAGVSQDVVTKAAGMAQQAGSSAVAGATALAGQA